MIKIYHNTRCSKSRECYAILESKNVEFATVKYMDETLSEKELREIISLLKIKPIELVRVGEADWKTKYKGKELSDDEIINAMLDNPKLIERPIVINNGTAVIGRPPSKVLSIL